MILLGSKAPERNVEQHDYYFGIAASLKELVPAIRKFWPEAGNSIHLDGWREVTFVDGFQIKIVPKQDSNTSLKKLFFINLGGYQPDKLEEQHYTLLSVNDDRKEAIRDARKTIFYKTNTFAGAVSHIDEKYGIDVDDVYQIEDILTAEQKAAYHILITPAVGDSPDDVINLGYFKLDKI